jgi:hypothetical protein
MDLVSEDCGRMKRDYVARALLLVHRASLDNSGGIAALLLRCAPLVRYPRSSLTQVVVIKSPKRRAIRINGSFQGMVFR